MGLNAQTAVPEFQALEVLTAAEMTQVNTGIPVFATTTTRDAAFGGAGEKVLAEGQFAYIEASNATQYYDGSTWQTLGATPGMTLVTAGSTSAASTLTLDNVFTSSYRNYKLFIDGVTSADDIDVPLKFRAGGATNSNSNYTRQSISGAASGVTRSITSNGTSFTSVIAGGTTTGGTWVAGGTDSAVEYNITGTSFSDTGGRGLASGFTNGSNQGSAVIDILKEALFKFQLERNSFTSTPYELTLVVASEDAGADVLATMDWEEVAR